MATTSYYDHIQVKVTYPDGKGNHTTTIGEIKQRFSQESKEWLSKFLLDLLEDGTNDTRFGTYTLIEEPEGTNPIYP